MGSEGEVERLRLVHEYLAGEASELRFNISGVEFDWAGLEDTVDMLADARILDKDCAGFLKQASEPQALEVLATIGPEARNPSAIVTRKLKDLVNTGAMVVVEDSRTVEEVTVFVNGVQRNMKWYSLQQAASHFRRWGLLDDGCANFLMKASERQAKEIIAGLGPEARKPSAIVTRKLKALEDEGILGVDVDDGVAPENVETLVFHFRGQRMTLPWYSQEKAVKSLLDWGVIDDGSAGFLIKAPEQEAKEIISSIGPTVQNPSAMVTKKLKALQDAGAEFTAATLPEVKSRRGARSRSPWRSQKGGKGYSGKGKHEFTWGQGVQEPPGMDGISDVPNIDDMDPDDVADQMEQLANSLKAAAAAARAQKLGGDGTGATWADALQMHATSQESHASALKQQLLERLVIGPKLVRPPARVQPLIQPHMQSSSTWAPRLGQASLRKW